MEGLALVAEVVRTGDDSRGRTEAVGAMHQRVDLLLSDRDPVDRLRELAAHAALLSDLSARYSIKALEATSPKHAAIWQRLALQCQAAYTRSPIAIEGLEAQADLRDLPLALDVLGGTDPFSFKLSPQGAARSAVEEVAAPHLARDKQSKGKPSSFERTRGLCSTDRAK